MRDAEGAVAEDSGAEEGRERESGRVVRMVWVLVGLETFVGAETVA